MGDASEVVEVTIRIEPHAAQGHFDRIVENLRHAGLREVEPRRRLCIVNGRVGAAAVASLSHVEGVASVRADQRYRVS
jgi:hypothetical protein